MKSNHLYILENDNKLPFYDIWMKSSRSYHMETRTEKPGVTEY